MTGSLTTAEATALLELLESQTVNRVDRPYTPELRDALRKLRAMAITLDPFPYVGSGPEQAAPHHVTTGVLAAQLDISERTLRHLADTYTQVYGELPRRSAQSRARLFPLSAVVRLTAAHQMMRDVPGTGALEAFTALRGGGTLRRPEGSSGADSLALMRAELQSIQTDNGALQSRVQELQAQVARLQTRMLGRVNQADLDLLSMPTDLNPLEQV